MSMGAVMYRTGKINGTDLGGLYRTMPLTCIFCMVGAASISAFPLFSGFVSKSMVMDAAASGHMRIVWFVLLFASAGVFHHAGIKIPYFAFFSHDSGLRPKEAPIHMLLAMGIAAFLCIFIGTYPAPLYALLPYPVDYVPYTAPHVVGQTQLLFFSALAFTLLLRAGIYPAEIRCINLDADWFYRKGGKVFFLIFDRFLNGLNRFCDRVFVKGIVGTLCTVSKDIAARLSLIVMVSIWILMGVRGERLRIKKMNLYADMMGGTVLIGIGAGVSTLFLVLIFILT
jgi:multicomponent Na+:H+ antiporter subunit D